MKSADITTTLPQNISICHQLISELLGTVESYKKTVASLEHRLDLLLRSRYGSKSEKINIVNCCRASESYLSS
ncbi:MAG: transposase domain-containing protein [Sedimentisphaerales bacterium]